MNKTILSRSQIENAHGEFTEALHGLGARPADNETVPQPRVADVINLGLQYRTPIAHGTFQGAFVLGPKQANVTAAFPGLRGVARYKTAAGIQSAPAIVLRDGENAALLTAEANPGELNALKHGLLESLYVTQRTDVTAHSASDAVRMTGGHALVAASFAGDPMLAHNKVHALVRRNFGTEFDRDGNRDIAFGQELLRVRSAVLPLAQIVLEIAEAYQPHENDAIGGTMAAGELNVAMTVAAALSRRAKVDLTANMEAMVR